MASLTDSEEEAEQRPSFQNLSVTMAASHLPVKAVTKRSYSLANTGEDARKDGPRDKIQKPSEFIKTNKPEQVEMSETARKMMAKMGHREGEGLGKHSQGRTHIVEASTQRGRRGLGLVVAGFEPQDIDWDFSKEEVINDEVVQWMPPYTEPVPTLEEMMQWKIVGPVKKEIDDETNFCSEEYLNMVLDGKSVFDVLDPEEMRRARTRSNPYETIRGAFFLNRAAMKLANMDAILDFMFTNPKTPSGEPLVGPNELLYFADICAGPGGFSEYVLWRTKGESKGFGLTLKGSNDFKLEDFFAGPPEMFEPHYGVGGINGDGDIFRPDNQEAFANFVLQNTDKKGVHFVMADGGFSVEGQENIQEILSKQLYLCQFLVAVSILREGGHFVCKLFDLFTPFSVGLVYLMNMIFEQVSIIKPVTSRPANSERYIICKSLKANKESVQRYMYSINLDLCQYMSAVSKVNLLHIVPLQTLINDERFFTFMVNSNEQFARIQAVGLKKIEVFTKNNKLHESRQSEVRRKCMEKWKIPDEVRVSPRWTDPNDMFQKLINNSSPDIFEATGSRLTSESLQKIKCLSSYSCVVRAEGATCYILGCRRTNVFKWDGRPKCRWQKLENNKLELPSKTLLEVQAVQELRGEGKGQRKLTTFHVLNAFFLCGEDVRGMSFEKRREKLQKFVKALRKPSRTELTQLYAPEIFPLDQVDKIFDRLEMRSVKSSGTKPRLCYSTESGNFFHPAGLSIIQTVKEPWIRGHSKSTGRDYWYNIHSRQSLYDCPLESIATVRDCKTNALHWLWEDGVKVHPDQEKEHPDLLSKEQFVEHIDQLKQSR